jgi:hypothetical protein
MKQSHERLEAELSALKPSQPSAELERRLAEQLQDDVGNRRPLRWTWLLAAAAVAAGITAAILLPRNDYRQPTELPAAASQTQLASAFDDALPSLWQYRAALNRSAYDLDAALDKHSANFSEPNPERARAYVFSRLNSATDPLGDL